jgi:hypothetical protein
LVWKLEELKDKYIQDLKMQKKINKVKKIEDHPLDSVLAETFFFSCILAFYFSIFYLFFIICKSYQFNGYRISFINYQ